MLERDGTGDGYHVSRHENDGMGIVRADVVWDVNRTETRNEYLYSVKDVLIYREAPVTYREDVALEYCLARRGWDSGFKPHYGIKTG